MEKTDKEMSIYLGSKNKNLLSKKQLTSQEKNLTDTTKELTLPIMGQNDIMWLVMQCPGKHAIYLYIFPSKNAYIKSNHEEIAEKPKLREILQNKWLMPCKNFQFFETLRKKDEERLKETKKT